MVERESGSSPSGGSAWTGGASKPRAKARGDGGSSGARREPGCGPGLPVLEEPHVLVELGGKLLRGFVTVVDLDEQQRYPGFGHGEDDVGLGAAAALRVPGPVMGNRISGMGGDVVPSPPGVSTTAWQSRAPPPAHRQQGQGRLRTQQGDEVR